MSDTLRARAAAAFADGYDIDAEIGRGGMGVVYRCRDMKLRRFVAIKVLPPELAFRDDVRTRFLREAETAAQLNHPNIVPIYSVDEREGLVWFVMGLVDGESLAARLHREQTPPFAEVRRILREVADALAYAHGRGIIHRDIKPDNILLDRLTSRPIVTDFGIARAIEGDSRLTVTGTAVGTPAYMSPEQAMGEGEIDGRSDLYSLAVVGYQMLAGELPFKATNTPAMLMKHLSDPLRPLRTVRGDVPDALAAVIERCLAKKPHQRWRDAAAFRDALDHASIEPARAGDQEHPSGPWKRPAVGGPRSSARPGVAPRPADPAPIHLPRLAEHRHYPPLPARHDVRGLNRGPARPGEIPSFMPPSWRHARQDWSRHGGRPERPDDARSPERRIRDFRHALARTGVGTIGLVVVNVVFSPAVPWALIPITFMSLGMLRRAGSLWADGIRVRDAIGRQAGPGEPAAARGRSRDTAPPARSVEELARELAPADVLAGPFGDVVRRAASDRAAARTAIERMSPVDREMIPDVGPTLDDLAKRVGSLAHALHGLEHAADPDLMASVEHRLEEARSLPESTERDKRIDMLEKQRHTLSELAAQRERLRDQIESAALMLQSMRLDLVALGSAGVQSAMNDATGTTQEARALSRDLRIALEAARELRT
jgi:serine/threonine-protein kinase